MPGTTAWKITQPACVPCTENVTYADPAAAQLYGSLAIQGYASKTSVNPGEPLDFFVSTGAPTAYSMEIFRIGWYGGAGGKSVLGPIALNGSPQSVPTPASNGLIECHWPVAYSLTIPADWVSGFYLAKLTTAAGKQRYIVFVVRDDSRPSPYLFISAVNTYQAYNEWGGSSLYTRFASGPSKGGKTGYAVSFDRPYWRSSGTGDFLAYEINMVRWLEKEGYDTSYATDVDVDQNPDLLLNHKAALVVGHSEYWSWRMRANVEQARDRGISLGFFSGNDIFWQVRYAPDSASNMDRTIIAYKEDAMEQDPWIKGQHAKRRYASTWWSNNESWKTPYTDPVNRPEEALMGIEYESPMAGLDDDIKAIGDITVTDPSRWPNWLSADTGLYAGATLPNVLGYETDRMHGYQPLDTVILADSVFPKAAPADKQIKANSTVYIAPSGAIVLATGSIYWDLGLDGFGSSPGVVAAEQQMTRNFLMAALQTPQPALEFARLPAQVSASGAAPGYPAKNAGDGSDTSLWVADSSEPAWVQLDLGTRRWVQSVKWLGANGDSGIAYSPTTFAIEVSADGANWQTVASHAGQTSISMGDEVINQQARYLRMFVSSAVDGQGTRPGLFEFWAEGGPPPTIGRLRVPNPAADFAANQLNLGSRQQINRVTWDASNLQAIPKRYLLQVSDNGTAWTTALTYDNAEQATQGDLNLSTQGTYLRLLEANGTGAPASGPEPVAFDVYGSSVSMVLGALATASSEAAGYPAANAEDGFSQTPWLATLTPSPADNNAWFQLDFGTRRQIDRVRWQGANGAPFNAAPPTDYTIQVSNDGVHWGTVLKRQSPSPVINGDELLNVEARYLRLLTTKVGDGTGFPLGFLEFWAEGY
ncbi:MAG TPA: discoidin domain-containing protein [Gammaproteobacteria bacterium]|nr:discoidin domain-containing protein [Gammaproteobacteria bacterium]